MQQIQVSVYLMYYHHQLTANQHQNVASQHQRVINTVIKT